MNIRNQTCSCGSGKKAKRCCESVASQATDDSTKTKCAPGGDLSPSICSGYSVAERWWQTTLESAPSGLFMFGGAWGFKTEYGDENGPEAYCVESGEYFWGGTSDKEVRRKLLVQPVIICPNASDHGLSPVTQESQ